MHKLCLEVILTRWVTRWLTMINNHKQKKHNVTVWKTLYFFMILTSTINTVYKKKSGKWKQVTTTTTTLVVETIYGYKTEHCNSSLCCSHSHAMQLFMNYLSSKLSLGEKNHLFHINWKVSFHGWRDKNYLFHVIFWKVMSNALLKHRILLWLYNLFMGYLPLIKGAARSWSLSFGLEVLMIKKVLPALMHDCAVSQLATSHSWKFDCYKIIFLADW